MFQTIQLLNGLAEPTRLAAVRLLWDGAEHCLCELMTELGATQSRMSRHMSVLKQVGLVVAGATPSGSATAAIRTFLQSSPLWWTPPSGAFRNSKCRGPHRR